MRSSRGIRSFAFVAVGRRPEEIIRPMAVNVPLPAIAAYLPSAFGALL